MDMDTQRPAFAVGLRIPRYRSVSALLPVCLLVLLLLTAVSCDKKQPGGQGSAPPDGTAAVTSGQVSDRPALPTEPADTADSSDPESEGSPSHGQDPSDPTDPTHPTEPTQPADPADPADPTDPADPDRPENPEDSTADSADTGSDTPRDPNQGEWDPQP